MDTKPPATPRAKARRLRSPSYPCIGLPEAIHLARQIYAQQQMHPGDQDMLTMQLGYDPGSAWFSQRLSALSKFGLLELIPSGPGRSRGCVLTALGDALVNGNPRSDEYKAALREAALRPGVYDDLWTRFGPDLPANNRQMATYLIEERKFNPNAVDALVAYFRATAEHADLKSMTRPKPQIDAATLDAYSRIRTTAQANLQTSPQVGQTHFVLGQPFTRGPTADELHQVLSQRIEERDERIAILPLANNEKATIIMSKKMSPQSWQMLIDTLELWKRQSAAGG